MNQQLQSMSETRENDFKSAIKARDEAVRDAKLLAGRVETLEEALRSQVGGDSCPDSPDKLMS